MLLQMKIFLRYMQPRDRLVCSPGGARLGQCVVPLPHVPVPVPAVQVLLPHVWPEVQDQAGPVRARVRAPRQLLQSTQPLRGREYSRHTPPPPPYNPTPPLRLLPC